MYPEISYRYPTATNQPITDLTPEIILDWSVDVLSSQFSDAGSRANLVVLMDDLTSEVLSTSYVSYTASTRRLILTPTATLLPSRTYRILVKSLVESSDGRKSKNQYTWTFDTAAAAIGQVVLVDPADASIQSTFPTLDWVTISGSGITYQVQIDDSPIFSSINYVTTTASSFVTPSSAFSDNTTYYWRVRAYTSAATGAWSETWQFYYGTRLSVDESSRQTWESAQPFGVTAIGWDDGDSNRSSFPTISITFSSTPASTFASYLTIRRQAIIPRNDTSSSYSWSSVAGSWALSSNTATFTPSESISTNTRYEVLVDQNMVNTSGEDLDGDLMYYFTGPYTPYYCSLRTMRAKFLSSELQLPDDLINYEIYSASLEANARYYGTGIVDAGLTGTLTEALVRDSASLTSFAVGKWVEAATYYNLLKAILNENLRVIGRDRTLGDFKEALSADFVKGLQMALQMAKEDIQQYEEMLAPSHNARGTERNIAWHPNQHLWDLSIRDHEGRRHL